MPVRVLVTYASGDSQPHSRGLHGRTQLKIFEELMGASEVRRRGINSILLEGGMEVFMDTAISIS